jgi:hypothetical protein
MQHESLEAPNLDFSIAKLTSTQSTQKRMPIETFPFGHKKCQSFSYGQNLDTYFLRQYPAPTFIQPDGQASLFVGIIS